MSTRQRGLIWLFILLVALATVYLLRGILLPFVVGMATAYLLDPICDWFERRGLSRTLSTVVVLLLFIVVVLCAMGLLGPLLYSQAADFAERVPEYVATIEAKAAPLLDWVRQHVGEGDVGSLGQSIEKYFGDAAKVAGNLFGQLMSGLELVLGLLSLIAITPIVTFYLLRDWDRIVETVDGWLPLPHREAIRDQMSRVDETLAGFVRGQLLVCLILGAFYAIGLTIIGLEFGAIIGIFAGLISFIPYVGSMVGLVLSVGTAIGQFGEIGPIVAVAGVFLVGQAIEGNILQPTLVGDRVNLHPVWIIFALMAGGALFGFVGVLLAVPVAAVVGVAMRFATTQYLHGPLYLGSRPKHIRQIAAIRSDKS